MILRLRDVYKRQIFSRASLLVSELGTRPMKIQSQTFERLVLGQLFETTGPREGQDLSLIHISCLPCPH